MPFRFNPFTDKLDLTETGGGGGGGIQTITSTDSVATGPDGAGNVNLLGNIDLASGGFISTRAGAFNSVLIAYNPIVVSAQQSGNVFNVTGDGTAYQIIFDQIFSEIGTSGYDPTTGIFTVPVNGNYLITSTVLFGPFDAGLTNYRLSLNSNQGQSFYGNLDYPAGANTSISITVSGICTQVAGDQITVLFTATGPGGVKDIGIQGGLGATTTLQIVRVS